MGKQTSLTISYTFFEVVSAGISHGTIKIVWNVSYII